MLAALLCLHLWATDSGEHTLSMRCELDAIELGVPFELSFERRANAPLELLPFEPRAPEGLVLERLRSDLSPGRETLHYRARAFALGGLRLEGFESWVRDSEEGTRSAVTADPHELIIRPALPPGPRRERPLEGGSLLGAQHPLPAARGGRVCRADPLDHRHAIVVLADERALLAVVREAGAKV